MNSRVNEFRNAVSSYRKRASMGCTGEIALDMVESLVSRFGSLSLVQEPFSFLLYGVEDGKVAMLTGGRERVIDEYDSESLLDLIYTFKDDIKLLSEEQNKE